MYGLLNLATGLKPLEWWPLCRHLESKDFFHTVSSLTSYCVDETKYRTRFRIVSSGKEKNQLICEVPSFGRLFLNSEGHLK